MSKSIEFEGRQVLISDIVDAVYDEDIEADGDVVDHEPVTFGVNCSTLTVTLSDGETIVLEGGEASGAAEILKEKFPKILD